MKAPRVYVTLTVFAALLAAFFLVPLPVSRVHETGLLSIDPAHAEEVRLPEPARLVRFEPGARSGRDVRAGELLAVFKSEQVEVELAAAVSDREEQQLAWRDLTRTVSENRGRVEDEALKGYEQQAKDAEQKAQTAEVKVALLKARRDRLAELRAPRAGLLATAPKADDVGKLFDRGYGESQPVFMVGDPTKLVVRVPVTPQHYRVLKDDLPARGELDVTLYVKGRSDREFHGKVRRLPGQNAATVPIQLTQRGGGPLAVKPGDDPNVLIPLAQTYLVEVELTDPDAALRPGQLASAKIHARWRSGAWWVGQALANALDLGLFR